MSVCDHGVLRRRGLHGSGDGGNPADSAENPQEWGQVLREYRGDGNGSCVDPAGMEFAFAGAGRGRFRNLADDKSSRAALEC